MAPTIGGFCKRMNVTFFPDEPYCNDKQPRVESRKLIEGYFTWLFENVSEKQDMHAPA